MENLTIFEFRSLQPLRIPYTLTLSTVLTYQLDSQSIAVIVKEHDS